MSKSIAELVKEKISDMLGVESKLVVSEAKFIEDLHADSLDLTELVLALEEEFDVEISDAEVEQLKTVGQAIACIESLKGVTTP